MDENQKTVWENTRLGPVSRIESERNPVIGPDVQIREDQALCGGIHLGVAEILHQRSKLQMFGDGLGSCRLRKSFVVESARIKVEADHVVTPDQIRPAAVAPFAANINDQTLCRRFAP
jgi:hypothetical protein